MSFDEIFDLTAGDIMPLLYSAGDIAWHGWNSLQELSTL